jgi:hypothetical protein
MKGKITTQQNDGAPVLTQEWTTLQELQEQIAHAMCNQEIISITIIKTK